MKIHLHQEELKHQRDIHNHKKTLIISMSPLISKKIQQLKD